MAEALVAYTIIFGLLLALATPGFFLGKWWLRALTRRRKATQQQSPSRILQVSVLTSSSLGTTLLGVVIILYSLVSTAFRSAGPIRSGGHIEPPKRPGYDTVDVFFATDRAPTSDGSHYGTKRESNLHLGVCAVSIPAVHEIGTLERPRVWRFEFSADPNKHLTIQKVREESESAFLAKLHSRLQGTTSGELFVFVHGFNVSFDDAVMRTAQLAYDLNLDAVPVAYSWPSRESESFFGYTRDAQSAEDTTFHLQAFLTTLANESGATTVYLLAHSMGSRPVTAALKGIVLENTVASPRERFKETILAAPDIDRDYFVEQIAPALARATKRVTVYASAKDHALDFSKVPNGNRRLGDATGGVVVVPNVDTIDATAVDTSLLGHSYYGDEPAILSDIASIFRLGLRPTLRFGMTAVPRDKPTYWVFQPRRH